jgi:hypothetical protein
MIMKRIKSISLGLFVAALVSVNFVVTTPAEAFDLIWKVTCNYDANGDYTGGSCTSGGQYECQCAPRQLPGEN